MAPKEKDIIEQSKILVEAKRSNKMLINDVIKTLQKVKLQHTKFIKGQQENIDSLKAKREFAKNSALSIPDNISFSDEQKDLLKKMLSEGALKSLDKEFILANIEALNQSIKRSKEALSRLVEKQKIFKK